MQPEGGAAEEQDKIVPIYSITKDGASFDVDNPVIDAGEYSFKVTGLDSTDVQSKVSDYLMPDPDSCVNSLTISKRELKLDEIDSMRLTGTDKQENEKIKGN